jgi:hypothetical protein
MIRLFKNTAFVIGVMALILGIISLVDALAYNDGSIASLISIVGFSFVGIILLNVAKSLTVEYIKN